MSFFTLERGPFPADIEARIARAIGEVPPFITELLKVTGEETIAALHDATPVGVGRTGGHLADSYSIKLEGDSVAGLTDQPLKLNDVRYGTTSPIVPLRAKALWWPEAAHPYASVHGQQANNFVTPVLDEIETFVQDNLEPLVQGILATLRGE